MNRKIVLTITGQALTVEAIALLIPAFVSLIYGEREALGFTAAAAIALVVGMLYPPSVLAVLMVVVEAVFACCLFRECKGIGPAGE